MTHIFLRVLWGAALFVSLILSLLGVFQTPLLDRFDFLFLTTLLFLAALYRPGWIFLLLLAILPFETISLSPLQSSFAIRPFQLAAIALMLALFLRFLVRRFSFPFSRVESSDALPVLFSIGVFGSAFASEPHDMFVRQSFIVLFFVALFFLSRQFLKRPEDARRIFPFLLLSILVTSAVAILQSILFSRGFFSFEAMPGRPNAFFPEPDWLGMYLIVGISALLSALQFREMRSREGGTEEEDGLNAVPPHSFLSVQWCTSVWNSAKSLGIALGYGLVLTATFSALILTVARSAWAGALLSLGAFFVLFVASHKTEARFLSHKRWMPVLRSSLFVFVCAIAALLFVRGCSLTNFSLADRAASVSSGWQTITVSCVRESSLPEKITETAELASYGCRHIRLESIDAEASLGRSIRTVERPDPSIEARKRIREKTISSLREHWLFGMGWGGLGSVLGTDDRGATLNASNVFLEVLAGGGLLGLLAFSCLWFLIPYRALCALFGRKSEEEDDALRKAVATFFLVSWVGLSFFNLFNSGILLGFLWVWLGGIGMLGGEKNLPNEG